jgi:hypothetical protein
MPFNVRDNVFIVKDHETGEIDSVLSEASFDVFEDARSIVAQHHEQALRLIPLGRKRVRFTTIKEYVTIKTTCWVDRNHRFAQTNLYRGGPGEQHGGRDRRWETKKFPLRTAKDT